MLRPRSQSQSNIHESFSDVALLMLATFVFLLVAIIITSRIHEDVRTPQLQQQVAQMAAEIDQLRQDKERLYGELEGSSGFDSEDQLEEVLKAVGLDSGKGRKDFDVFISGLKEIPGRDVHLVIDATGSMHGASTFLVPLLRVIMLRTGKQLAGLSWYADGATETYSGGMGEVFDRFMVGAPFLGSDETIGRTFAALARQRAPGAYILLGDEPSVDRIYYDEVHSPIFPIAIGRANPDTQFAFGNMADNTGGKLLQLRFE